MDKDEEFDLWMPELYMTAKDAKALLLNLEKAIERNEAYFENQ